MSEIKKTKKHEEVSDYYGSTLQHSDDLKTNACWTIQRPIPTISRRRSR